MKTRPTLSGLAALMLLSAAFVTAGCQNQTDKDTIGAAPPPPANANAPVPVTNKPAPVGGSDSEATSGGGANQASSEMPAGGQ